MNHDQGLSPRLSKAMEFARRCHTGQFRKGTLIPYLSHPMGVSSIVLEFCGTEDQTIAALLHDVIEDADVTPLTLQRRFGKRVAQMVLECSDSSGPNKAPWKIRKQAYLHHLEFETSASTLLVSISDKLHNSRAINRDVRILGSSVWKRFNSSPSEIAWYYRSLLKIFRKREQDFPKKSQPILIEFKREVLELTRLSRK